MKALPLGDACTVGIRYGSYDCVLHLVRLRQLYIRGGCSYCDKVFFDLFAFSFFGAMVILATCCSYCTVICSVSFLHLGFVGERIVINTGESYAWWLSYANVSGGPGISLILSMFTQGKADVF